MDFFGVRITKELIYVRVPEVGNGPSNWGISKATKKQDVSIDIDFEFQIKSVILEDAWKSASIGSLHASNVA